MDGRSGHEVNARLDRERRRGDISVAGNDLVSDAVEYHVDSGELHTNTGICIGDALVYARIWVRLRGIYTWNVQFRVTVAGVTMLG